MSKMTFMEWVGLIIVIVVLIDYFQNNRNWFSDSKTQDKQSLSKKVAG